MLYIKNKKEGIKRSYEYLYTHDVTKKAKRRRKKVRTYLNGKPKN